MEPTHGQTAKVMKDNLSTIFEMAQESIDIQMARQESSCGKMVKFNIGFTQKRNRFIVVGERLQMNDVLPPVFSINKTYDEEIAHKGDRSVETDS